MSRYDLSVPRLVFLVAVVLLAIGSAPLVAETFVVNRFDDDNGPCTPDDCALREAVLAANALPGPDIVEIPGGTYQLSLVGPVPESAGMTGDLDIRDDLELIGEPAAPVTIVGDGTDRVIEAIVTSGRVVLSNLEIRDGRAPDGGGGVFAGAEILEFYDLVLTITRPALGMAEASFYRENL